MKIINSREVERITGFSYRHLQNLLAGNYANTEKIPHYTVVGKRYFKDDQWHDIPEEYAKSKVVYVESEVKEWFNKNYIRK